MALTNGRQILTSRNTKMPGLSFGLPRTTCKYVPHKAKDGRKSVCSRCYAAKGRYRCNNVQDALSTRLALVDTLLDGGRIGVLVNAIARRINNSRGDNHRFFRWYDTGDIHRPEMIQVIRMVAERCPDTTFWVSTRSWKNEFIREKLRELAASCPNVVIRPSGDYIGDQPPVVKGIAAGTAVVEGPAAGSGVHICPGSCSETGCRVCWTEPETPVIYNLH